MRGTDEEIAAAEDQGRDTQVQDAAADLIHADWLGLLIDREVPRRNTRRFRTRRRPPKLRQAGAAIEDVDYRLRRKLDTAVFQRPTTGR